VPPKIHDGQTPKIFAIFDASPTKNALPFQNAKGYQKEAKLSLG